MPATIDLQVFSTFNAGPLKAPLCHLLSAAGMDAHIGFVERSRMSAEILQPSAEMENLAGTVILVRVEDWLRDGLETGKSGDLWAREELKTQIREFSNHLSALVFRGAPVWFLMCPSNGWIANHHNLAALCRTYTNLLNVRAGNTLKSAMLNWPSGLSGEDRDTDRLENIPFSRECFDQLGEFLANEIAHTLGDHSRQSTPDSSPELANYLSNLKVQVELIPAGPQDREKIDRIIRTAASFSLSGEQPYLSDGEIDAAIASERCIVVHVTDRLGQHGPSGVVLYRSADARMNIEWFSLTCPVLGKQVEFAVLLALAQIAKDYGLQDLAFEYKAAARNQPLRQFLESLADSGPDMRFIIPAAEVEARASAKAVSPGAWTVSVGKLERFTQP
jgi:hypothetical protein